MLMVTDNTAKMILGNALSRDGACDDGDNWSESSFASDSIMMYRDLKTQIPHEFRYFSV